MAFIARCLVCGQKVRAPESSLGGSGTCPKCGNFFSLVPHDEEKSGDTAVGATAKPLTDGGLVMPGPEVPEGEPEEAPALPWMQPVGVVGLLLAAAGLLCAAVYSLASFVIPLAAMGFLTGMAGLVQSRLSRKYRSLLSGASTLLGGGILLAALAFPHLLGPMYAASRTVVVEDRTAMTLLPLAGGPLSDAQNREWADASQSAWQQGPLRVQIVSVVVGPAKQKATAAAARAEQIFICVRTRETAPPNRLGKDGASNPGSRSAGRPRLLDGAGKVYALRDVQQVAPEQPGLVFPTLLVDLIFAFEAPTQPPELLRFELPAEMFGGSGAFKFTIPGDMIRRAEKNAGARG